MKQARKRKPVNLSLDPELVEQLRKWCRSQAVIVPMGRAVDTAIREFLKMKNKIDGTDNGG